MEDDPGLPIIFGPVSNGEYDPEPPDSVQLAAIAEANRGVDEGAARTGMSRRDFLKSSCAMAVALLALDRTTAAALGVRPVHYPIPPEAAFDSEVADELFRVGDFVFDLQGHLLEYDLDPSTRSGWFWGRQFPQANCRDEDDPRACFTMDHFLEEVFVRSDTTMVALSGLPILPEGSPLPPEVMEETRRVVTALSTDPRVVVNALALPQVGPLSSLLEEMERTASGYSIHGWKTFTHFPAGMAWRLDDADPRLSLVGDVFLDAVERLGRPILTVHKGLAGGARSGSPQDVGPAAVAHPGVSFVVYHSGYEVSIREGPYKLGTAHLGTNRLIRSLQDARLERGRNVYAELGSTWFHLMRRPREAAHLLGKLLNAVGEDNVLWGTDSIFYGSPQSQIDAFRAFEIPPEMQEQYGYPALTPRIKAKILGYNAARLYGVDPVSVPLRYTPEELREARRQHPVGFRAWGPTTKAEVAEFRAHHRGWP